MLDSIRPFCAPVLVLVVLAAGCSKAPRPDAEASTAAKPSAASSSEPTPKPESKPKPQPKPKPKPKPVPGDARGVVKNLPPGMDGVASKFETLTYPMQGISAAYDITRRPDGDLYVVGNWVRPSKQVGEVRVSRLSPDGKERWARTYEQLEGMGPARAVVADDGGVFVAVSPPPRVERQPQVAHIDEDGKAVWIERFGEPRCETAGLALGRKGPVAVGMCPKPAEGGALQAEAWMLGLDFEGKVRWERTFDDHKGRFLNDVTSPAPDQFVAVGKEITGTRNEAEGLVVWLDGEGTIGRTTTFGGPGVHGLLSITPWDGGFAVAGAETKPGETEVRSWVVGLSEQGAVRWTYSEPRPPLVWRVANVSGALWLAGASAAKLGTGKAWLGRLEDGQLAWSRTFGMFQPAMAAALTEGADGNAVAVGYKSVDSIQNTGIWVLALE